mgnify:CR=1 FL=1
MLPRSESARRAEELAIQSKRTGAQVLQLLYKIPGNTRCADCGAADIDAAVACAKAAFKEWRRVPPLERARSLKRVAQILRENAGELAMIDAADCGNPVKEALDLDGRVP